MYKGSSLSSKFPKLREAGPVARETFFWTTYKRIPGEIEVFEVDNSSNDHLHEHGRDLPTVNEQHLRRMSTKRGALNHRYRRILFSGIKLLPQQRLSLDSLAFAHQGNLAKEKVALI